MNSLIRPIMVASFCILCLGLTACPFPPKIYRMDVRQGNFLTPEMIQKIKIGMEKDAVIEMLGTPALTHFLEQERWDYYYYFKPGNGDNIIEKHLSLFFKGNKIQRFTEVAR